MSNIPTLEQEFIDKGYTPYDPTPFDSNSIIKRYQKCFKDDVGKKYFIDILVWDNSFVPPDRRDKWWHRYSYEYSTQLYGKGTHDAIDFLYHSSWTLEAVEKNLEQLFATGLFDYYEEWDQKGEENDQSK